MGRISVFLTRGWIESQLAKFHDTTGAPQSELRNAISAKILKSIGDTPDEAAWGFRLRECMEQCELLYAAGATTSEIRSVCGKVVESFIPIVTKMDFTEKHWHIEGGMRPKHAKELAERFGGRWWQAEQYYAGVEYSCMSQPFRLEMPRVWMLAALAGDRELARKVAAPYRVHKAGQLSARFEIRETILRHALADDVEGEEALVARLEPGYAADFPPELIELPRGVVRRDPSLILEGVRKLTQKMKGKWDARKIRAWYDDRVAKGRRVGTWNECCEKTKNQLFSYHWVISWWALAWLNIARWRGIPDVFDEPKAFSEWVPLALCSPANHEAQ